MTSSGGLEDALKLPSGSRFFKCALQVNPYAYLMRHKSRTEFKNEADYNEAIVAGCKENGIDAIAVADHYRIKSSVSLMESCRAADIAVFPGFEAKTKDGVHVLCLFDLGTDIDAIERVFGNCDIISRDEESPIGGHDALEFFEKAEEWNALCVAAHVTEDGGLLREIRRTPRSHAWRSPALLACAIPGSPDEVPREFKAIVQNTDPKYRREYPMAFVNAKDVSSPATLANPGASFLAKMSRLGLEGLRQAFLDPTSRVRLNTDPRPPDHASMVAMAWDGGFLGKMGIHLNSDLNVLVGGRGAGKSTVIESVRYVLGQEPIGDDACKAHRGIVDSVLRPGTKISLQVRSPHPTDREYTIERIVPNPPIVRDEHHRRTELRPRDVFPKAEVFGQHEIAEISGDGRRLTALLGRFVPPDPSTENRRETLLSDLRKARDGILRAREDRDLMQERSAALPALEEKLERFREAGLDNRLEERSLLMREQRLLESIPERLAGLRESLSRLFAELPIDRAFVSTKALADLPGREILRRLDPVLERLSEALQGGTEQMAAALDASDRDLADISSQWERRRDTVEAEYQGILRSLAESATEGADFIGVSRQIEELRPLRNKAQLVKRVEEEHLARRKALLDEWEELRARNRRRIEDAAEEVSRRLQRRVRVKVADSGDCRAVFEILRREVGGHLKASEEAISRSESFSIREFVECCRDGAETVKRRYRLTVSQAERLAKVPDATLMQIEEIESVAATTILLNTAPADADPVWRELEDLSKGQKATAVLLLLLLDSEGPLIVDQPEDDLDNRFISEEIVGRMREAKQRRQFVFCTHNANIPVLGDAELILGLTPSGEQRAEILQNHMGAIDEGPVRDLVEDVLEGGRAAFETRRRKYGF